MSQLFCKKEEEYKHNDKKDYMGKDYLHLYILRSFQ